MRAATSVVLLIVAVSVLSSVQGLDYFTGQRYRRTLQQGTGIGGNTCQNGPQSAQYRCMSLSIRSSGYQFCARMCQTGLGRANAAGGNISSPTAGSGSGGGNSTRLETGGGGGLGGSSLGSSSMGTSGGGGCVACIDVQQQCQEGESNGGGNSNVYFKAYVNRYYSGPGCQDVTVGGGGSSSDSP